MRPQISMRRAIDTLKSYETPYEAEKIKAYLFAE